MKLSILILIAGAEVCLFRGLASAVPWHLQPGSKWLPRVAFNIASNKAFEEHQNTSGNRELRPRDLMLTAQIETFIGPESRPCHFERGSRIPRVDDASHKPIINQVW